MMIFPGHTSLSFAGNSFIKYRLSEKSNEEDFKLGLRLRTLQSNGIIMYTRANPCIILKVIKTGYLLLQSVLMLFFLALGLGAAEIVLSFKFRRPEADFGTEGAAAKLGSVPTPRFLLCIRLQNWLLADRGSLSRVGSRAGLLRAVITQQLIRMYLLINPMAGLVL